MCRRDQLQAHTHKGSIAHPHTTCGTRFIRRRSTHTHTQQDTRTPSAERNVSLPRRAQISVCVHTVHVPEPRIRRCFWLPLISKVLEAMVAHQPRALRTRAYTSRRHENKCGVQLTSRAAGSRVPIADARTLRRLLGTPCCRSTRAWSSGQDWWPATRLWAGHVVQKMPVWARYCADWLA